MPRVVAAPNQHSLESGASADGKCTDRSDGDVSVGELPLPVPQRTAATVTTNSAARKESTASEPSLTAATAPASVRPLQDIDRRVNAWQMQQKQMTTRQWAAFQTHQRNMAAWYHDSIRRGYLLPKANNAGMLKQKKPPAKAKKSRAKAKVPKDGVKADDVLKKKKKRKEKEDSKNAAVATAAANLKAEESLVAANSIWSTRIVSFLFVRFNYTMLLF